MLATTEERNRSAEARLGQLQLSRHEVAHEN
jgi:hypothetical protein